jgi:hypothetical protein
MKDGGFSGQGDEQRVAVEDEHEGERQEQQPDEGVGTRVTNLAEVPQRQRGEGVEDGGGERDPCEARVRELPDRTGKLNAITGAEAVYACVWLRFEPCKTSRATGIIQRSSHAKVTPNCKAIRSPG